MRTVNTTEVIFNRRAITCNLGTTKERNVDFKIESAVVEQSGHGMTISSNITQDKKETMCPH